MVIKVPFLKHWKVYQSGLIEEVKKSNEESQTWSGDGHFDSMGHSAKYSVYTMWAIPHQS